MTTDDRPAGRVLPVVRAPAGVLARPSPEVDPLDDDVVALAADLLATQRVSPGCVGLAAPQVGVAARVFSLDVTGHPKARTVHGGDRPGIVSAVTAEVAAAGGNVTNLTTRLSGDLYVVVAEVDLPASGEAGQLGERLAVVGARLGVQVSLRPVEPDLL